MTSQHSVPGKLLKDAKASACSFLRRNPGYQRVWSEADDLAQSIILRLLRSVKSGKIEIVEVGGRVALKNNRYGDSYGIIATSTHFARLARWLAMDEARRRSRCVMIPPDDDRFAGMDKSQASIDAADQVRVALATLDERAREIWMRRHELDETFAQIASDLHLTRQRVHQIYTNAQKNLRNLISTP